MSEKKTNKKKNILFINHSDGLHGAETVLVELLTHVSSQKEKYNIHIVWNKINNVRLFADKVSKLSVDSIIDVNFRFLGGSIFRNLLVFVYNLLACFKIILLIKREKIDVIYTNSSINPIGIICAILTKKKHIWHFHEPVVASFGWTPTTGKIYEFFLKYNKNIVVFISQNQKTDWETNLNISIKNYQLIYNPIKNIEKKEKSQTLSNIIVFGFMGAFTENKNISHLIQTFARLEAEKQTIKLKIAGNGQLQKKIEIQTKKLNSNNIEVTDYCFDVSSFYADIDVLVLPSYSEMMPLVVLEAMSVEKAVILTEKTGLHEMLTNSVDCIFINPFSDTDLYKAMKKVLLEPEYRKRLAKNGYEKVNKIDFNNQFQVSFDKLFKEI